MAVSERSVGDDVLRWVSEVGAGTWLGLREAAAHAMQVRSAVGIRPWTMAADLSALGHLDIDWGSGDWSAAPPCLVLQPGMGLCAYLAGWRSTALLDRFAEATDLLDVFPFQVEQAPSATALYAKCADIDVIEEVAERLGVPVVYDAAARIAANLERKEPDGVAPGAPPPRDEHLELFDAGGLQWVPVEGPEGPGLYRYELHGRQAFRLLRDQNWLVVDRAVGQLWALRGRDDVMQWHPPSQGNTTPPALTVHRDVSLPALAERAAVASCGLLPMRRGSQRIYRNVDADTARTLAHAVGLHLGIENEPIKNWKQQHP